MARAERGPGFQLALGAGLTALLIDVAGSAGCDLHTQPPYPERGAEESPFRLANYSTLGCVSPTPRAFLTLLSPSPSFPFQFIAFYCFPPVSSSPFLGLSQAQFGADSLPQPFHLPSPRPGLIPETGSKWNLLLGRGGKQRV